MDTIRKSFYWALVATVIAGVVWFAWGWHTHAWVPFGGFLQWAGVSIASMAVSWLLIGVVQCLIPVAIYLIEEWQFRRI